MNLLFQGVTKTSRKKMDDYYKALPVGSPFVNKQKLSKPSPYGFYKVNLRFVVVCL
jgi:hypothetical protein